ncbi:hypothetical protein STAFG_1297 [Streptomyces afghaniensis 772]|uniref:Uncharacterized protein n=1 Tax=Streptomyces afghaniensis 772 TaxID=1283301 RepID=S4N2T2_9ACTN|nr:hypothetical protein STAFG_1297 [Streptomyces afghaniensis 772]
MAQHALTQRQYEGPQPVLTAALAAAFPGCGQAYSRAGGYRARIGVVGACRLRSGHSKALPVVPSSVLVFSSRPCPVGQRFTAVAAVGGGLPGSRR